MNDPIDVRTELDNQLAFVRGAADLVYTLAEDGSVHDQQSVSVVMRHAALAVDRAVELIAELDGQLQRRIARTPGEA